MPGCEYVHYQDEARGVVVNYITSRMRKAQEGIAGKGAMVNAKKKVDAKELGMKKRRAEGVERKIQEEAG
jgi:hypothetical protein